MAKFPNFPQQIHFPKLQIVYAQIENHAKDLQTYTFHNIDHKGKEPNTEYNHGNVCQTVNVIALDDQV